ncbi:DNA repair protein RecO [Algoriphagus namhaensis]
MLIKTRGIVLSYMKYKESSIIAKIFTRELGLKSYIINGVRSSSAKSKIALYQPLSLLDLVVYDKANSGLQRISEVKMAFTPERIPFEFPRMAISMFMCEVISKSIHSDYQNEGLFDFLDQSILHLDSTRLKIGIFPLTFLITQAKYLGFAPERAREIFSESMGQPFSPEELAQVLNFLEDAIRSGLGATQHLSHGCRQTLIDYLLDFYSLQLGQDFVWKTTSVLRQVMS